jgi:hypothetical protein
MIDNFDMNSSLSKMPRKTALVRISTFECKELKGETDGSKSV